MSRETEATEQSWSGRQSTLKYGWPQVPLSAGSLAKLVLVISDAQKAPVERHVIQPKVFQLLQMLPLPACL
jgi:hypothetical protein